MAKPIIMTIDDEPHVLNAIARDLQAHYQKDYRIVKAGSGDEALEAVQEFKRRNDPIALFLVDQRMPGISGVEFLEEAIKLYPETKKVLLTAYADTDAAIASINAIDLDYYLMKPWDPPEENLYPVLGDESTSGNIVFGLQQAIDGYGRHEVIIDHPDHGIAIHEMSEDHLFRLIGTYRDRIRTLYDADAPLRASLMHVPPVPPLVAASEMPKLNAVIAASATAFDSIERANLILDEVRPNENARFIAEQAPLAALAVSNTPAQQRARCNANHEP